jgi:RHS repeat-associated protein
MNTEAVISEETYSYDAAGNIVGDTANAGFVYDTNNRLVTFNGGSITYDLDGNMLGDAMNVFTYDSSNRLITANGHTYTYNAEDVRIRKLWASEDTTYTYDTNRKLSRLLEKTTNGITTKYVYGHGLICEETNSTIKTYHFDNRGSTIAITDASGNVTDTFEYDTYGKLTSRTGTSDIIFRYNGRDGVITDFNGLAYMRARYYSPNMRRFINADIVPGEISNAVTLNRYAYANGNPVSLIDPFGLSAERGDKRYTTKPTLLLINHTCNKDLVEFFVKCYNKSQEIYYYLEKLKNDDGSYALYDNDRIVDLNPWHEQLIAINYSLPSWDLEDEKINVGLGSVSADLYTGGWEWENVDLSLLDLGHVEASAEINKKGISLGAIASVWSPSISFELFGFDIEIGTEIVSVGAEVEVKSSGISGKGAWGWGISFSISK